MLLALSPLLLLLLLSLATVSALNARSLDLSVTANALAAAYKDCTVGESCSLDVLDRFVVSAVAAFESGCSLNVLLMECDMEEDVDERLSDDDRRRRRAWLNAVSCTLTALNDANEIESRDVDLDGICAAVSKQAAALPRAEITAKALTHSYAVVVDDLAAACAFSNSYAPEHLIVNVENAEALLPDLDNAGSIFLGRYTPESVGDYASGTNHVLPTYGYSRMYSGVSLDSFVKYMTVQELTKEGLDVLGPSVATMAAVEGLEAHRLAVTLRLGIE